MKEQAMVMGDIVLFQDEVNPAMSAAFDAGLAVTALHNHFFYDDPKVYFMHIGGEGSTEKLVSEAHDVVGEERHREVTEAHRGEIFLDLDGADDGDTAVAESVLDRGLDPVPAYS
jgi:glycerate kinase